MTGSRTSCLKWLCNCQTWALLKSLWINSRITRLLSTLPYEFNSIVLSRDFNGTWPSDIVVTSSLQFMIRNRAARIHVWSTYHPFFHNSLSSRSKKSTNSFLAVSPSVPQPNPNVFKVFCIVPIWDSGKMLLSHLAVCTDPDHETRCKG